MCALTPKQQIALCLNMGSFVRWLETNDLGACMVGTYIYERTRYPVKISEKAIEFSRGVVIPPKWLTLYRTAQHHMFNRTNKLSAFNAQNGIRLIRLIQRVEGERNRGK